MTQDFLTLEAETRELLNFIEDHFDHLKVAETLTVLGLVTSLLLTCGALSHDDQTQWVATMMASLGYDKTTVFQVANSQIAN